MLVTLDAETPLQIFKGKSEIAHKLPDNPTPDQVVITQRGVGGRV